MTYIETKTYDQMAKKAANLLSAQVLTKPHSVLGLATGSTPLGVYRWLIRWYQKDDVDFSQATTVNLDEYVGLGEQDPQSYRYYMNTHFFDHINIPKERTLVPCGTAADPEAECRAYDRRIEALLGIDLQLLGIGRNGHIGFNEPADVFIKNTHVVTLSDSTVTANARFFDSPDDVPRRAITLGMGSILQARKIVLVANGAAKRDIVREAFTGPITPRVPASLLQLHPDVTVLYSEEETPQEVSV